MELRGIALSSVCPEFDPQHEEKQKKEKGKRNRDGWEEEGRKKGNKKEREEVGGGKEEEREGKGKSPESTGPNSISTEFHFHQYVNVIFIRRTKQKNRRSQLKAISVGPPKSQNSRKCAAVVVSQLGQ